MHAFGVPCFEWRIASTGLPPQIVRPEIDSIVDAFRRNASLTPAEVRRSLCHLSACDWPGPDSISATNMAWLYRAAGQVNIEWRDVLGCGHARLFCLGSSKHVSQIRSELALGCYWAIAITEPTGGSDPLSMKTYATHSDDGYVLNGNKQFIGRILEAQGLIVFARVEGNVGLSAFGIQGLPEGIGIEPLSGLGLSGTSWSRITLKDVRVPTSWRIGGEGQGMSLMHQHFSYWRSMIAAVVIGAAESLLVIAAQFARRRQISSGSLHQATHFQIEFARVVGRLRGAWLLTLESARAVDFRLAEVESACIAKVEAVESALECVELWRRFMGGLAFCNETLGANQCRAIEAFRSADGTTDALRVAIAKRFLEGI